MALDAQRDGWLSPENPVLLRVAGAAHVVPASWVSESRVGKPIYRIDVRWTWSDVVALRTADTIMNRFT